MNPPDNHPRCEVPVSIVMPVRNEIDVIAQVITEWTETVLRFLPDGSEILLEDGLSSDGTYEYLCSIQHTDSRIRVVRHHQADGFGNAARRLYTAAKNDLIFFTDSDGQYVAAEFWKLVPFIGQYELIHGAKISRQDPLFRKLASAALNWLVRILFDVHYSDINCAFHFVGKETIQNYLPRLKHLPTLIHTELMIRAALENRSIHQVFVLHRRRAFGTSRGLPPGSFLREALRAYKGLLALKSEYSISTTTNTGRREV